MLNETFMYVPFEWVFSMLRHRESRQFVQFFSSTASEERRQQTASTGRNITREIVRTRGRNLFLYLSFLRFGIKASSIFERQYNQLRVCEIRKFDESTQLQGYLKNLVEQIMPKSYNFENLERKIFIYGLVLQARHLKFSNGRGYLKIPWQSNQQLRDRGKENRFLRQCKRKVIVGTSVFSNNIFACSQIDFTGDRVPFIRARLISTETRRREASETIKGFTFTILFLSRVGSRGSGEGVL